MAKKSGREGKRISLRLILIPIVLVGLILFSFFQLCANVLDAQASLLNAASERIALRVTKQLDALLDTGQQFRSLILEGGDASYVSIKSLADSAMLRYPYISAITLAPGAIIRYSFPEEKNSASIGHDLLDNPERMHALIQAVSKKQVVLQGPEVSAEGVDLAFLRFPVFKTLDLWGFISIAIDVDTMLNGLALKDEFPGLRIACAARTEGNAGTRAFWGDERVGISYSSPVDLGGGESMWSIAVASVYPASRAIWWGGAIAVLSILCIAALFFFSVCIKKNRDSTTKPHREHFDVSPFNEFTPNEKKVEVSSVRADELPADREITDAPHIKNRCTDGTSSPSVEATNEPSAEQQSSLKSINQLVLEQPEKVNIQPLVDSRGASKPEVVAQEPATVLVVDDSEVNRELLVRMLKLKGYRVESLSGGALAMAMLDTREFDVLLVDCIMPDMDGYTLARAIRNKFAELFPKGDGLLTKSANKIAKTPLLIAMSPCHDAEEAEKCVLAGFDGLLIKPFTMTSLDQKIQEMLKLSPRPGR